jgi:hypothetical protein
VFFKQMPLIEYIKERCVHVSGVWPDTAWEYGTDGSMPHGNAKSMSNLCKNATICWGEEAVAAANKTRDVRAAREALEKLNFF